MKRLKELNNIEKFIIILPFIFMLWVYWAVERNKREAEEYSKHVTYLKTSGLYPDYVMRMTVLIHLAYADKMPKEAIVRIAEEYRKAEDLPELTRNETGNLLCEFFEDAKVPNPEQTCKNFDKK